LVRLGGTLGKKGVEGSVQKNEVEFGKGKSVITGESGTVLQGVGEH